MQLVHEQDEVTSIDVVAHAVDDEEEVTPVLGGLDGQGCGLGLILLIILFGLILGLRCLLLGLLFLWLLFLVLLSFFLGLFFFLLFLFFRLLFLRLLILGFCCRFCFKSLRLLLDLL